MSKIIKLTPEHIKECMNEFENNLISSRWSDGKVNFNKTIGTISRKAKILFTDIAWLKMQALVREFDKEVAWHGVAFRDEDFEKDEYIITDIVVYPQKVTGASVEMDTAEYAKWIEDNIEDDRFCDIRMQGHSHVNMHVSPSAVDLTHQEDILNQLSDKMFYIFMIWNKKGDKNIKIYDLLKNVLFETSDIDVEVLDDGYGIDSFVKDAKTRVKDRVVTGYQYAYSYQYGGYTPITGANNAKAKEEPKTTPVATTDKSNSDKRKGKMKKEKGKNKNLSSAISKYSTKTTTYLDSHEDYAGYLDDYNYVV